MSKDTAESQLTLTDGNLHVSVSTSISLKQHLGVPQGPQRPPTSQQKAASPRRLTRMSGSAARGALQGPQRLTRSS